MQDRKENSFTKGWGKFHKYVKSKPQLIVYAAGWIWFILAFILPYVRDKIILCGGLFAAAQIMSKKYWGAGLTIFFWSLFATIRQLFDTTTAAIISLSIAGVYMLVGFPTYIYIKEKKKIRLQAEAKAQILINSEKEIKNKVM